jgi:hypothetical protein
MSPLTEALFCGLLAVTVIVLILIRAGVQRIGAAAERIATALEQEEDCEAGGMPEDERCSLCRGWPGNARYCLVEGCPLRAAALAADQAEARGS